MKKQAFFITATNTDTGKTFVTASLLNAFLQKGADVVAIKPVQSGAVIDKKNNTIVSPDVLEFEKVCPTNNFPSRYALEFPSSPHYAAQKEGKKINIDEVISYCTIHMEQHEITLIEGAGGIFVPLYKDENEDVTFLDVMKQLAIPVILVCKNELGMINQTLLSIECLQNHGLDIAGLVINFTDPEDEIHASNVKYLASRFSNPIITLPDYGTNSDTEKASQQFFPLVESIQQTSSKPAAVKTDEDFDREHIWHPYTSTTKPLKTYGVTKAEGHYIYLGDKKLLDGMSSWWCAVHGYNNKELNTAVKKQLDSFSHVMFGGLTHAPAINLAKKILSLVPPNLSHIFYCDSGSVSVEVAMKMALQYQQNISPEKNRILTVLGGYHGDTFGAMSVCDPENGMHFLFQQSLAKQIFAPRPSCRWGEPFDEACLESVRQIAEKHKGKIAAIIIEPLVQGAGGMWFYHENYLHFLRELSNELGTLLIFDEIATGFGRTGELFASNKANVSPDIMCIGKALTGGYMSFGATLASRKVADTISQNNRVFMHGPTFMANPLACATALKSIEILQASPWKERVANLEAWMKKHLAPCRQFPEVADVRVLGAIGVVELTCNVNVEIIQEFFVENGVWIRPFGKNIYIMPPFGITEKEASLLCSTIFDSIKLKKYK